jgi:putative redox protein
MMAIKPVLIRWTGNLQFIGTDSGNHSVVISAHNEQNHTGIKPSDLLLLALGSCSAYDVVAILEKKKAGLKMLEVEITSSQAPDPPFAFRTIQLHFHLRGTNLTEKSVDQAILLSVEKYCSVAATVNKATEISYTAEIEDA